MRKIRAFTCGDAVRVAVQWTDHGDASDDDARVLRKQQPV
jgi:hypothetical protein